MATRRQAPAEEGKQQEVPVATRRQALPVPQQRAVVGRQQQKVAGNNNRRALGDIGNVVGIRPAKEGKPLPQISRPVTRAQLRNAKAATVSDPDVGVAKKPEKQEIPNTRPKVVAGRVNSKKGEAAAKHPEKPKSVTIAVAEGSARRSRPSRKKTIQALSSVLTARSKVACGIKDKPVEEPICDIDASDGDDELAAVEYVEDIYTYYKSAESTIGPRKDYMESQVELNQNMRAVLIDWLIEVHKKFELTQETLYLTVNILDRYLSLELVLRKELQLAGISAMLIACKYEEIWAPEVYDFICISDRAYSREQILAKEKAILNRLEWFITVPTPYMFVVRYLKAAQSDKEMEQMVFFYAELLLLHYQAVVSYTPSMLAAAAVYAARCTLGKTPRWTSTLKHHTGYSTAQLHDCAMLLGKLHSAHLPGDGQSKLKAVRNKYSSPALRPPARSLLDEAAASSSSSSSSSKQLVDV